MSRSHFTAENFTFHVLPDGRPAWSKHVVPILKLRLISIKILYVFIFIAKLPINMEKYLKYLSYLPYNRFLKISECAGGVTNLIEMEKCLWRLTLKTENIRKRCGNRRQNITLEGASCRFLFWDILLIKLGSKVTSASKLVVPFISWIYI